MLDKFMALPTMLAKGET